MLYLINSVHINVCRTDSFVILRESNGNLIICCFSCVGGNKHNKYPYGKSQIYFTITQVPDMDMWHPEFAARTNSVPGMC